MKLVAERGNKKSRFRNPASTVALRGTVVDIDLVADCRKSDPTEFRNCEARGAAWSKMNPGLGLVLKKDILSDCDLRKLRTVGEGAGTCNKDRIAAG